MTFTDFDVDEDDLGGTVAAGPRKFYHRLPLDPCPVRSTPPKSLFAWRGFGTRDPPKSANPSLKKGKGKVNIK